MRFDATPPIRRKLQPLQISAPDILDWLLAKDPTAIGSYLDMGPEEYARAFTAAQTAGTDIADDLYFAMVDTVAQGGTAADFAGLVVPTLKRKGWLGGDQGAIASRVQLIYATNLQQARRAGRWESYQKSKALLPYLRAFTVGDERVRRPPKSAHDHTAWDGIILPIDHWFWGIYGTGGFDFRCRCDTVQMSRSELARYRGGVTSDDDLEHRIKRIGPPRFLGPGASLQENLAAMVEPSNTAPDRMPGLPPVDSRRTEMDGRNFWGTVIAAQSQEDLGRRLAANGFR